MRVTRRPQLWIVRVVFLLGLTFSALHVAAGANVKLNGVLPAFGDVTSFTISPDGRYAVYKADANIDGVTDIFSVLLDGGLPVPLNPLLPAGRKIGFTSISPDSSRVVYLADQDTSGVDEIFSVPIGGPASAGSKISGPLIPGGKVWDYRLSSDGKRVVYRAIQDQIGVDELYSVPIVSPTGYNQWVEGAPIFWKKLNRPLTAEGDVKIFMISPDSSRVVYLADQERDTVIEVYSVPLVGPAEAGVKLNRDLVDGGSVKFFPPDAVQISADSSRVVYMADQQINGQDELYSVPLSGPAGLGVKLNGLLTGGGNVMAFRISPDSSRVVYLADQDIDNVYELYSTPLGEPAAAGIKLTKLLTVDGDVIDFEVSPDSRWVVYRAYQDHNELFELHRVPLMGPTTLGVKIGPLLVGGVVKPAPFDAVKITPDSSRVVYIATQLNNGQDELFSVPISGPAGLGVKLNAGLAAGGDVTAFLISPDSRRVVYLANQQAVNVFELFSTPSEGPASTGIKLNGSLTANGSVKDFFGISPDSGRVLYIADQDTDEMFELYMTSNYWLHLPLITK